MRALLDVDVLVALLDADHVSHGAAATWVEREGPSDWTSCPITQNGCVRIMSHPGYPNPLSVALVMARLAEACASPLHTFWPDDLSLLDPAVADPSRIHGPRQFTDLYLVALATRHRGRLVTFDRAIALEAVRGAARQVHRL